MKKQISFRNVLIIIALTVLVTSVFFYAFTSTPSSTSYIQGGIYPSAVAYTIWREGHNYFVKDAYGQIDCSGTNAREILGNTFNALENGERVLLKNGEYLLTGNFSYDNDIFHLMQDKITISGEGFGSIIKLDDNSTEGTDGARILWLGVDSCVLQNFAIDGNYQNQGSIDAERDGFNIHIDGNNCTMSNVFSRYGTGDGVEFSGIRTIIEHCVFIENWEQDIHANSAHDAIIIGNLLEREINNGMISLYCQKGYSTEKIIISNNILRGGSTNGISVGGAGTVSNVIISDNILQGITGYGIKIGDPNEVTNIKITGNIIRTTTNDGIRIERGTEIEITNNKIDHCDTHGIGLIVQNTTGRILISNNQIYDNNQDDTGKSGIYISNGNHNLQYLTIRANQILSVGSTKHNCGITIGSGGTGSYIYAYIHYNYIFGYDTIAINEGKSFTNITDNWT